LSFLPTGLLIFALLIACRNPDSLIHAQFWGEDGWFWYPDAYHQGLHALLIPHSGYYQTISRLIAFLAAPFPLTWTPTLYALSAFVFQWLTPAYLLSSRGHALCPNRKIRFLIGVLICLAPNTTEVYVNLTNSQWHLAALALLILLSDPPQNTAWRLFETIFLTISVLSGPFCLLLLPIASVRTWNAPDRTRYTRLAIIGGGMLIQAIPILETSGSERMNTPLGAKLMTLLRLLAAQIFLAPLIGHRHLPDLYALPIWRSALFPWGIDIVAFTICIAAAIRSYAMRYTLAFAILMITATLTHPVVSATMPQWNAMLIPDTGMRYFYIPILIWLAALVTAACTAPLPIRLAAAYALAICMMFGIPHDRKIGMEPDRGFRAAAHRFDTASPGAHVVVPVRPGSSVELVR